MTILTLLLFLHYLDLKNYMNGITSVRENIFVLMFVAFGGGGKQLQVN
jgi:hypothetical protein